MWRLWVSRLLPYASRNAEMVPACCNVCRTCTTTNIAGLLSALGLGIAAFCARFARRLAHFY